MNLNIHDLFNRKVAPFYTRDNQEKYSTLPVAKNNRQWKWEGKDFPRVISILEFEEFLVRFGVKPQKLLLFADNDPELELIQPCQRSCYPYEKDPQNHDLHSLCLPEKDFDFCLLNQTLEHLYDPASCLKNLGIHMKEGGILHVNAPANNIPHMVPYHYYTGFTLMGLVALLESSGFSVLSCGQWGNTEYLTKLFANQNWPDYRDLSTYKNEFNCPVIVWANARKIK